MSSGTTDLIKEDTTNMKSDEGKVVEDERNANVVVDDLKSDEVSKHVLPIKEEETILNPLDSDKDSSDNAVIDNDTMMTEVSSQITKIETQTQVEGEMKAEETITATATAPASTTNEVEVKDTTTTVSSSTSMIKKQEYVMKQEEQLTEVIPPIAPVQESDLMNTTVEQEVKLANDTATVPSEPTNSTYVKQVIASTYASPIPHPHVESSKQSNNEVAAIPTQPALTNIPLPPPNTTNLQPTQPPVQPQAQTQPIQLIPNNTNEEGGTITTSINHNDVLCGRGAGTNKHIGNIKFRQLVQANQLNYINAKVVDKVFIAGSIVDAVHTMNGRFLKKVTGTSPLRTDNEWMEISKQQAREKTSQALREKPDRKNLQKTNNGHGHITNALSTQENTPNSNNINTAINVNVPSNVTELMQSFPITNEMPPLQVQPQQLTQVQQIDPQKSTQDASNAQQVPTNVSEVVTNLTSAVQAMSQVAVKLENAMQAANIAYGPGFMQQQQHGTANANTNTLTPIAPAPVPTLQQTQEQLTTIPALSKPERSRSTSRSMAAIHLNPNAIPIQKHQITDNDVLFGRGGVTNNHVGNRRYRELVRAHQQAYLIAPKTEKAQIARKIVDIIRHHRKPPGRFLVKGEVNGTWVDVGDERSREKTSQALREKAPEMRRVLTAAAGLVGVNKVVMNQKGNSGNANNNLPTNNTTTTTDVNTGQTKNISHLQQQQQVQSKDNSQTNNNNNQSLPSIPLPPPPMPGAQQQQQHHHLPSNMYNPSHNPAPQQTHNANVMYQQNIQHPQQQQQQQNYYHMNTHQQQTQQSNMYYPPPHHHHQQQQTSNTQQQQQHQQHLSHHNRTVAPPPPQPQHNPEAYHHIQSNTTTPSKTIISTSITNSPSLHKTNESSTTAVSSTATTTTTTTSGNIQITQNDVLYGRGAGINCHIGNQRFRQLVKYHQKSYLEAPKLLKGDIARSIVASIRNSTPPGRFLSQDTQTGKWVEVDDNKACEKTSQALREKAPEIRKSLVVINQQKQQPQPQQQVPSPQQQQQQYVSTNVNPPTALSNIPPYQQQQQHQQHMTSQPPPPQQQYKQNINHQHQPQQQQLPQNTDQSLQTSNKRSSSNVVQDPMNIQSNKRVRSSSNDHNIITHQQQQQQQYQNVQTNNVQHHSSSIDPTTFYSNSAQQQQPVNQHASNNNVSYTHQHAPPTVINQHQQQPAPLVNNVSSDPTATANPLANTVTDNNVVPLSTIPNNNVNAPSPAIVTTTTVPPPTTTNTNPEKVIVTTNNTTTPPMINATNNPLDNNQISNSASDNSLSKQEI